MRFMMLMYPGPAAELENDPVDGNEELMHAMMAFNQRMVDAGVLLSGDGLQPTRKGARIKFGKGEPLVIDGPFTESKEVLGGYWIIQAGSLAEAVSWARQAPCPAGEMIDVRPVWELEDFGPNVAAEERALMDKMTGKTA
jgi:hypothetical protein